MFFYELDQNLQNGYFKKLFWMYLRQKPVEYSPSGVLDPLMLVVAKGHTYLKLVSAIFYQVFVFSSSERPKTMKNAFYFILKALLILEIFKFL